MTQTISDSVSIDSTSPRVFSLIVAAGKGSRFGSDIPKQYTAVNGKTILQQSVAALAASSYIKQLLLVIAKDDKVANSLDFSLPVTFTYGGDERWQSVQAGVEAVFAAGAKDEDLILIHDAARPCVLAQHIDLVIQAAMQHPYGAILGVPVADTLKQVSVEGDIQATIDRSSLWQAQTPQVFRAAKLRQVLRYVADEGLMITDEASAFEAMGHSIKIVPCNNQNLKLTYAEDLTLIESILGSR
ncbi:2-C-methyl-D-erythritol 4-phosphate cytidylyltransferase [Psychrobacter phenylpyruvicus]|uniref:2-C-methyl-D-erythritol 4-phosphate cytidylyltransferase n=1 Tax=Psychrobacter phenylpyruvicus TaxID=29432 RepID=A0A379LIC0_9GAMM|nr:2-C-methyl-D-erythritol 4-phosphate cytidylyltransferase [Psychrobacter phenylpyruvicus]SUD90349.1 2-C-methyl-D-erythritol 4-phosphate cytidylyltransferase [Psychrobacter phenylpyruvicus]